MQSGSVIRIVIDQVILQISRDEFRLDTGKETIPMLPLVTYSWDAKRSVLKRILVGIVVDNIPRIELQALTLVRSLHFHSEGLSVLVVLVGDVSSAVEIEFRSLGCNIIRIKDPINFLLRRSTPHCNKILFFATSEAHDTVKYDLVVYLDCDILVTGDFLLMLQNQNTIQFRAGKVSWGEIILKDQIWKDLSFQAGYEKPLTEIGWPNTGVIVVPSFLVADFHDLWFDFIDKVSFWLPPNEDLYFLDTFAFIFTVMALCRSRQRGCWMNLPVQMNCQLNWPLADMNQNMYSQSLEKIPPMLVQYNQGTMEIYGNGTVVQFTSTETKHMKFLTFVNDKISIHNRRLPRIQSPNFCEND